MLLPTKMTNRRQFLGRSALGAGSLLFGPLLLESCTDHTIPPNGPTIPLFGDDDDSTDWNDDAKTVITTALGFLPEAGSIIAALAGIFWPSSGSVWDQIKDQVEEVVGQAINADTYVKVSDNLKDLKNVLDNYKLALHPVDINGNPTAVNYNNVITSWREVDTFLIGNVANFQQSGDEVLLLPLFAQFANLYLAIYRDGVAFGKSWGFDDSDVGAAYLKLTKGLDGDMGIDGFTNYVTSWNTSGQTTANNTPKDEFQCEPFRSVNAYNRLMTLSVLDYMDSWKYYDVTQFANGATNPDGTPKNLFTREIYSDPFGNTALQSSTDIVLPGAATQFPTQITVWGGDRIDAVQLTYPAGGGPNGATTTPRMGDSNGGTNQTPGGAVLNLAPDNPYTIAVLTYDNPPKTAPLYTTDASLLINNLLFSHHDGKSRGDLSPGMGGESGQYTGVARYKNRALSSIYIHGTNKSLPNSSADCIVFGFLPWPPR